MFRHYLVILTLAVAVALGPAACGGGGGGGGGGSDQQEVLDLFTPEPTPPLATTFDERTFAEVANSGNIPSVVGDAEVVVLNNSLDDDLGIPLTAEERDKTVTAVAAAVNLGLGSTQLFAVVRDGEDALTSSSVAPVTASSIQLDVDRFELDWDPDETGNNLFNEPGAWNVWVDFPGDAEVNVYVQFEDEDGQITKTFGIDRTEVVRIATEKTEIGFLGVDLLSLEDVSWEISEFRAPGDVIKVNGSGQVEIKVPRFNNPEANFEVVDLLLDFSSPDALRRPEGGEIRLKYEDALPLGGDVYAVMEFEGDNDARVTVEGLPACDAEFEWNLSNGIPKRLEIQNCL
jgi:hypothetical protein